MKRRLVVLLASALVLAFAVNANAQEIRRYDDAGKAAPTSTSSSTTDGKDSAEPSNFVTVFNTAVKSRRGKIDLAPDKMYRGIIPGTRDLMPHVEAAKRTTSTNTLTWVGFQPNKDGSVRIFLQTANTATYSQSREGKTLTVTLSNTKIPLRNFSRYIDTTFFNNNVNRIESKQKGDDVIVTISLKEAASTDIETEGNYIYLNF